MWQKIRRHLPNWLKQTLYWLRTRTYNKYHLLDCRSKQNGYTWGWQDICSRIVFANMNMLKLYVEHEADHIDWTSDPEHIHARAEMEELYQWWMRGRKIEHDAYDALINKTYGFEGCTKLVSAKDGLQGLVFTKRGDSAWEADCDACSEAEKALTQKDEDMLIRLIKIKNYLWS